MLIGYRPTPRVLSEHASIAAYTKKNMSEATSAAFAKFVNALQTADVTVEYLEVDPTELSRAYYGFWASNA